MIPTGMPSPMHAPCVSCLGLPPCSRADV
jgi:hypothetical protein